MTDKPKLPNPMQRPLKGAEVPVIKGERVTGGYQPPKAELQPPTPPITTPAPPSAGPANSSEGGNGK